MNVQGILKTFIAIQNSFKVRAIKLTLPLSTASAPHQLCLQRRECPSSLQSLMQNLLFRYFLLGASWQTHAFHLLRWHLNQNVNDLAAKRTNNSLHTVAIINNFLKLRSRLEACGFKPCSKVIGRAKTKKKQKKKTRSTRRKALTFPCFLRKI